MCLFNTLKRIDTEGGAKEYTEKYLLQETIVYIFTSYYTKMI